MAIVDGKIRCSDCKEFVFVDMFSPSAKSKGYGVCNPCSRVRSKAYQQRFPEKYKASQNAQRAKDPQKRKEAHAEWRKRPSSKRKSTGYYLKSTYKMSIDEFEQRMTEQGGVCALCRAKPDKRRRLSVDHCHETGAVRGLLCLKCNSALAQLGDNLTGVMRVVDYLKGAG